MITRFYNNAMVRHQARYYENSGYFNFGYWDGRARSQREASEALVDRLIDKIASPGGRILDVACGAGASTRRLMERYPPEAIAAINISEPQLAEARKRAPGCGHIYMDAARLGFPDNCFNAVISVEAAFHFDTREAFLREVFRVLRPGGTLVLSDILFRPRVALLADLFQVPRANLGGGVAHYERMLQAIGFASVEVEDATGACLTPFRRNLARWPLAERKAGRADAKKTVRRLIGYGALSVYFGLACKAYVLAVARK